MDLDDVLARVKELIRENEELGDMVLEAGRESKEEWQKALEGEQHLARVTDPKLVVQTQKQ